jgi:hypothetical protein
VDAGFLAAGMQRDRLSIEAAVQFWSVHPSRTRITPSPKVGSESMMQDEIASFALFDASTELISVFEAPRQGGREAR